MIFVREIEGNGWEEFNRVEEWIVVGLICDLGGYIVFLYMGGDRGGKI